MKIWHRYSDYVLICCSWHRESRYVLCWHWVIILWLWCWVFGGSSFDLVRSGWVVMSGSRRCERGCRKLLGDRQFDIRWDDHWPK